MQQPRLAHVAKAAARYDAHPADGGLDTRIRIAVVQELPDGFEIALLRKQFPEVPPPRIRRIIDALRNEGRLRSEGHGRGTRWRRT